MSEGFGLAAVQAVARKVIANVEQALIGKRQQIVFALAAALSEGHVLLEDVPGVAKTMLARALAQSMGVTFNRVQCTPDLLPSDILGTSIFHPKSGEFVFRRGPIFCQILLADEINRATPRTQSALLEAMAEGRVSIDGATYRLDPPFLVIATQNPIEHEGTFPLPEAQLDRFLLRFSLGYPQMEEEIQLLGRLQLEHPIDKIQPVISAADLLNAQKAVRRVHVEDRVKQYIVELVHATREHQDVRLGGSPRAGIALFRTGQAVAAMLGRGFVLPDDIKRIFHAVLGHRIILRPESRLRRVSVEDVLNEVLDAVPVPIVEPPSPKTVGSP